MLGRELQTLFLGLLRVLDQRLVGMDIFKNFL